jgi:hypothetical protein
MIRIFINVTMYPQYNNNKKKDEVMCRMGERKNGWLRWPM